MGRPLRSKRKRDGGDSKTCGKPRLSFARGHGSGLVLCGSATWSARPSPAAVLPRHPLPAPTRPDPAGVIGTGDETGAPFICVRLNHNVRAPMVPKRGEDFPPFSSTIL